MVLWVRPSLLLFMQSGTLGTRAELISASCFPTLNEHSAVATSDLSLVPPVKMSPTHKVFCNGNQSGFWTYNTNPKPKNRACLDTACYQAPNHVALTWLPGSFGNGLSKYNISFEGMWTAFVPGLTVRAAYLSLGLCFVMNGGNGIDSGTSGPDWFGGNMSGFDAASFHSFFIEVTTHYTNVYMDGKLVFQDGGVGMKNYLNNRNCQPLGHYTTGAMFGGLIAANGRSIFSRVEGQVRNVRLTTEIPGPVVVPTTSSTGSTQSGAGGETTGAPSQGAGSTTGSTPTSAVATIISSSFHISVNNAASFVTDPQAKAGVQQAIANVCGVSPKNVHVNLSIASPRRLDAGIERLLSSGPVLVAYMIHVPAGSPSSGIGSADSVMSTLANVTIIQTLTSALMSALSGGSTSYVAVVTHSGSVVKSKPRDNPNQETNHASWAIFCRPLLVLVALWHLAAPRALPDRS